MSRVGKSPITVPGGVNVTFAPDLITVAGPKGTLTLLPMENISFKQEENTITAVRANEDQTTRARHGLMRSLVQNMVTGVTDGFSKQLELNGVGYRVALAGTDLKLQLGFSHEVVYPIPSGVTVSVDQNIITISGIDRQLVGQVAADIRELKKPEPYKGKGIKYVGERIIRKSGKSGKEK
jgi:large subunit ribosomal protein L6